MTYPNLKIGSRASRLATTQVEEVLALLAKAGAEGEYERITFATAGDLDKITPLTSSPADDFFTNTLDEALLRGEIHVAVHSAKDLPQSLAPGLSIFALTEGMEDSDAWVSDIPFHQLPNGARVGTSSLLRQKAIKDIHPQVEIVDIRGTIEERIELVKTRKIDGVVIATCALRRLALDHLIKDVLPWEGMPLQGQLAVVGRSQDTTLKKLFEAIDVRRRYGTVYLVGAGPGDPDLLTLKAVRLMGQADCVVYDYLVNPTCLRHAPQAEHIYAGKRKGHHTLPQAELSKLLKNKAIDGKNVVRLKGGDPLIFGRGADEISFLQAYHINVQVVPGITSATGIPASLGVPLTARGYSSSVAFLSAHGENEPSEDINPLDIPDCDTLVFLMGLSKLGTIIRAVGLTGRELDMPVIVISQGTRPEEKIVNGTLKNIEERVAEARLEPPALIIIGPVAQLYRPKPAGALTLYTGSSPERYRQLGTIVHHPMIQIRQDILSSQDQGRLTTDIAGADLVILTSRYAVEAVAGVPAAMEFLRFKPIAVIGQDTAKALYRHGANPVCVACEEHSEGLLRDIFRNFQIRGKRIVFPRSSLPNPYLKDELTKGGAHVTELTVYENTKPAHRPLPDEPIEQIIFTSPSTVRNFLTDYGKIPPHWTILSRGPATTAELREHGYSSQPIEEIV